MSSELAKPAMSLADSIHGKSRALTVSDVATLLAVSERQVYKLAAQHRIPCFKIGGSIRFDPLVLASWLRQKIVPGAIELPHEQRRRA
jgi:excisionase family DNA binding protein